MSHRGFHIDGLPEPQHCHGYSLFRGLRESNRIHGAKVRAPLNFKEPQLEVSQHQKGKELLLSPRKLPKETSQETQHHIRALIKVSSITLIKTLTKISSHHQNRQAVAIQSIASWGKSLIILLEVQTPSSSSLHFLFCFTQKLWCYTGTTCLLVFLLATARKEAAREAWGRAQPGRNSLTAWASISQAWHDNHSTSLRDHVQERQPWPDCPFGSFFLLISSQLLRRTNVLA